ncbi:hypothetical protein NHP194004_15560 [Helicobacter suis]|nr:hypothetical protein NHP194004_15560 [Helicobacter suis]
MHKQLSEQVNLTEIKNRLEKSWLANRVRRGLGCKGLARNWGLNIIATHSYECFYFKCFKIL